MQVCTVVVVMQRVFDKNFNLHQIGSVYRLFRQATEEYGVPSRVRSDKGGESILVCQFMITVRGSGRGSHIAGSSVHNQRISSRYSWASIVSIALFN